MISFCYRHLGRKFVGLFEPRIREQENRRKGGRRGRVGVAVLEVRTVSRAGKKKSERERERQRGGGKKNHSPPSVADLVDRRFW